MGTPIVLNELSCEHWPVCNHAGAECIRHLAAALRELGSARRKMFLLSHVRIGELMLGSRPFGGWMADASVRDALRQLLVFANKSPFESFADFDADGVECFVEAYSSRGALFAELLGTVTVSFPSADLWSGPELRLRIEELDSETGEIHERKASLRNVACVGHVEMCLEHLSSYRSNSVATGEQLWCRREEWFPSLKFLPRVRDDIIALENPITVEQVTNRLFELDSCTSRWHPGTHHEPAWNSRVTGEGEGRKRLCRFVGADGQEHTYDMHARYTPGPGRIHFRLVPADRVLEVAYVGRKLGS